MKIDKKRGDFNAKSRQTFYANCSSCCCCCLMWIGGLIGAGIGAVATKHRLIAFRDDSVKIAMLSFARKWYWSSLLLLSPVLLLVLFLFRGMIYGGEFFEAIILLSLPPAINFFVAALVTSAAISYRIVDKELRGHINMRNWTIFGISLIGYVLGWLLVLPMLK